MYHEVMLEPLLSGSLQVETGGVAAPDYVETGAKKPLEYGSLVAPPPQAPKKRVQIQV